MRFALIIYHFVIYADGTNIVLSADLNELVRIVNAELMDILYLSGLKSINYL